MSKGMNIATALHELGLDNTATKADVKQAYKDLARIWHPDRFQNDERLGARTEAKIKLINEARTVALDYLGKFGHFQHVSSEKTSRKRSQATREYSYAKHQEKTQEKQAPPREKPPPRAEKQAPPRQKAPPRSKPKRPDPPPVAPDLGFHMDQGLLVVIFIILIMVSFLFMLGFSLLNPPEDKLKVLTTKMALSDEKARLRKEWEDRRAQDIEAEKEEVVLEVTISDTFFTLGSKKEWVSEVQGAPLQIKGGEWHYGSSFIRFGNDFVVGWKNSYLNPLKIGWVLDSLELFNGDSFQIGSPFEEVIVLQGTPDVVDGNHWIFGEAIVIIDADTVVSWENDLYNILQAPILNQPAVAQTTE